MELNFIIFPAPKSSYTAESLKNELLWIPVYNESNSYKEETQASDISKDFEMTNRYKYYGTLGLINPKGHMKIEFKSALYYIPCLLLKPSNYISSFILLYFHGNGEDINLSYDLLNNLRNNLQIYIMAIEYPGYGIYKASPSADRINQDSAKVYDFLVDLGFKKQNILVLGRSIGTGAATELAANKEIGVLALISPFTSLKDVAKEMVGRLFKLLVKDRFNNKVNIAKINCPTLIVHGILDTMIPVDHSFQLHEACKGPCALVTPKNMNHFQFDFYDDFTNPLMNFLEQCGIILKSDKTSSPVFPPDLFLNPF